MKITYIVEDFSENGGVERIVTQKANELSNTFGHEVSFISVYDDPRQPANTLAENIKAINLKVPFAIKGKGKIITAISRTTTLIKAVSRLNKALRETDPDIIFFTTTLGAILLPLCRTKAIRVYESHLARKFTPYNVLFRFTELKTDAVVCLTEGDAADFKHAHRVETISNFIEPPKQVAVNYAIKKAIAVGRLEKQKGFDILIECWKEISLSHPDWHLDIYGEGNEHAALQRQIDDSGMETFITLCGRTNSIIEKYPQYSLYIMPSRYEGQGITLIEAQACALPSVAFNFVYGASDIIENGKNGFLVKQGDTVALTAAINRMMDNEQLRRSFGESAAYMAKRFYKENIFIKWTNLISSFNSGK